MENKKAAASQDKKQQDTLDSTYLLEDDTEPLDKEQRDSINPLGEDLRLTHKSVNQLQRASYDEQITTRGGDQEQRDSAVRGLMGQGSPKSDKVDSQNSPQTNTRQKSANIFGRQRSSSKPRDSRKSLDENKENSNQQNQQKNQEKLDREFERKCAVFLKTEDWNSLEDLARDYLAQQQYNSYKGYFYLGVCFYKQGDFENAIKAFKEAETISAEDAQLHYNLGLSYFKLELYNPTVEHWRKCIKIDPQHRFVYNNLAFLFNLHQFYPETINICGQAKLHIPDNHNCHRHWAFALFKKGEMTKAVKKIKKGIQKNPKDADNWIMWGVILRYHGNYKSSRHKFLKALKLDKDNETAREELQIIDKIIELDQQIPLDEVPAFRRTINKNNLKGDAADGGFGAIPNDEQGRNCGYLNACGCSVF